MQAIGSQRVRGCAARSSGQVALFRTTCSGAIQMRLLPGDLGGGERGTKEAPVASASKAERVSDGGLSDGNSMTGESRNTFAWTAYGWVALQHESEHERTLAPP